MGITIQGYDNSSGAINQYNKRVLTGIRGPYAICTSYSCVEETIRKDTFVYINMQA